LLLLTDKLLLLTDTDLRDMSLEVHPDANFTVVSDSCMSGGLIEDAQEQVGDSTWTPIVNSWEWGLLEERRTARIRQGKSPRLGVLLSSGQSRQVSFNRYDLKRGHFTTAFTRVARQSNGNITNV
jgi:hypothetical protein